MNEKLKYKDEPLAYKEFPEKEVRQKYPDLKDDTVEVMKKRFYKDGLDKETYRYQQFILSLFYEIVEETNRTEDEILDEFNITDQEERDFITCYDMLCFSFYSLRWE